MKSRRLPIVEDRESAFQEEQNIVPEINVSKMHAVREKPQVRELGKN